TKAVDEYIRNQKREDMIQDNLSKKEYMDPFKG
ncbi:IS200/IS605 family transposase, partial [Pasteurella multocida]|nr:IS200/IS605 family transposase [Pasteurella multocida]